MIRATDPRVMAMHLGVVALLFALHFVLPPYFHGLMARVMVFAVFAMGFNLIFGYAGMLSLGHALFFAAGVYGCGLAIHLGGWSGGPALALGVLCGGALAALVGLLALRTVGVAFMIVTLLFAQAGYLATLYFSVYTRGEEGFPIAATARALGPIDLTNPDARYLAALVLFSVALFAMLAIVRSPFGRVLVALRENPDRAEMLGYAPFRYKLTALTISGVYAGAAGAAYALFFGYVGSTFASIEYSIFPLLWTLLGGAGTTLGPFIGALAMYALIDVTSGLTSAYMILVGVALLLIVLAAPAGVLGALRARLAPWLP